MHESYTHEPDSTGIAMMDMGELRELVVNATEACLQVCLTLHAVGVSGHLQVSTLFTTTCCASAGCRTSACWAQSL